MAGWMVESAFRYGKASSILLDNGLLAESEVNAALAMEILLKSLLAEPDTTSKRKDTVAQPYRPPTINRPKDTKGPAGHDLYAIYLTIPEDVRGSLGLARLEPVLKEKRFTFSKARYMYEPEAPIGSNTVLLHTFALMLPNFVHYFIRAGSEDPWLLHFIDNPDLYELPNGRSFLILHDHGGAAE